MDTARQVAVLFADVSDSTKLYESAGDRAAMEAIAHCLSQLQEQVRTSGGRVVKTLGDAIMAVFPSADAAAMSAGRMQHAIDALRPVGPTKLGIRIGFHLGPVLQSGGDLFGDTVNLAARLVEQAAKAQILTSQQTASTLGPQFRSFKRALYGVHVKGKTEEIGLCELIWRQSDDMTLSFSAPAPARRDLPTLRLQYREQQVLCRRHDESITLGRDIACGLVVANARASRQHCVIERRQDKFVLTDKSTNGTYVTPDGGTQVFLQREACPLGKHGWISLGLPYLDAEDAVEYFCD